MSPCGIAIKSRTHIVGECGISKELRDVLEEEFDKEGSSENTIATYRINRRWMVATGGEREGG